MGIVISGTTNDITVDGVSVATDAEVSSAIASTVSAGTIIIFAAITAPDGHLKANGVLVSRTVYSALFAAIGTTFGAGDGSTTFALPDLRAYFPRGWDDGRGIDASRVFGSYQADEFESHIHELRTAFDGAAMGHNISRDRLATGNGVSITQANNGAMALSGGVETRPKNIALLYCIKY